MQLGRHGPTLDDLSVVRKQRHPGRAHASKISPRQSRGVDGYPSPLPPPVPPPPGVLGRLVPPTIRREARSVTTCAPEVARSTSVYAPADAARAPDLPFQRMAFRPSRARPVTAATRREALRTSSTTRAFVVPT